MKDNEIKNWITKAERHRDLPVSRDPVTKTLLGTLEGCPVWVIEQGGVMRILWVAKMAVCCDGMPENSYNDPCYEEGTAYWNGGKYINADAVPYIVVPPLVRYEVEPVVMGCQGMIVSLATGQGTPAMVADEGPSAKIGEASCEAASRCSLSRDPNDGGTDEHIILYTIWPGMEAEVDGITYDLQPS